MTHRIRWYAAIACILLMGSGLVGCSKDLSRPRAAELISAYKGFKKPFLIGVIVGHFWLNPKKLDQLNAGNYAQYPMRFPFTILENAGILTVRQTGKVRAVQAVSEFVEDEYLVELTRLGENAAKSWSRTSEQIVGASGSSCVPSEYRGTFFALRSRIVACGEPGIVYAVGVGKPMLDEVTGLTQGTDVRADFNWHWVPSPEARTFANTILPSGVKSGQATFRQYDDGWRVTNVDLSL